MSSRNDADTQAGTGVDPLFSDRKKTSKKMLVLGYQLERKKNNIEFEGTSKCKESKQAMEETKSNLQLGLTD